jgi:sulfate permease, SulP family
VLKGFIVGLALTIIVGQLPKLFGIKKGSGDFFQQLWHVITHLGNTHGLTLLVEVVSFVVIVGLRRLAPVVPGSLVAVLLGIVAVKLFQPRSSQCRDRRADQERWGYRRSTPATSARSPPAGSV